MPTGPGYKSYGYKRLVVGAHYGWRDFLVQRISAVVMALFTLLVVLRVLFTSGPITYDTWAGIFASQWMKSLTFVAIVAVLWHAWIGMCSIWLDYGKPTAMRLFLQAATVVWLVACAGWVIQVLWRF